MPEQKTNTDFETSLEQLEALVTKMEKGQLSLDQSLEAFEEGIKLTRTCQEKLKNAEQRVNKLVSESEQIQLTPFDESDQD